MNKEILRKVKEKRGITLIALVITIIVLLILAGITLSMVLGPNGIIERAKQAKEQTQAAALNEQLMFNEVDNYLEEQLSDKSALKIIVNSGDNGVVVLPVTETYCDASSINWGDGTTGIQEETSKETRLASIHIEEINIAGGASGGISHTYAEKNKEYTVEITGNCSEIDSFYENVTKDKIIEIAQWGENGLERICLEGCTNLKKVATPSKNSFVNITSFDSTFALCTSLTSIPADLFANCPEVLDFSTAFADCSSLRSIPADLFANCPEVLDFSGAFANCSSLTSIPSNLFANCPNVTTFLGTFMNCTSLTGDPIKLWEEGRAGITETTGGEGCYANCTGLNGYAQIPEHWTRLPK